MRTLYVTLGLAGWLLLAAASLRFDVINVEPKNGRPYTVRRIAWPWEGDVPDFTLKHDGVACMDRYSFFGLYGQGCQHGCIKVSSMSGTSSRIEVH